MSAPAGDHEQADERARLGCAISVRALSSLTALTTPSIMTTTMSTTSNNDSAMTAAKTHRSLLRRRGADTP